MQLPSIPSSFGASTIILVVAISAYHSAIDGVFLFDDLSSIVENLSVANGVLDSGNWLSTRPLTQMSFAANYAWSQLDPISYHWTNNVIHAIAGIFLFLWLRETFVCLFATPQEHAVSENERSVLSSDSSIRLRRSTVFALLASLMWIVHPINTQAVTYIVQRGESLMGLFFFAFHYFVAKAYQSVPGRASLVFQFLAFGALVMGLASKQVMLTAVPVGLLYARMFFGDSWYETFSRGRYLWLGSLAILILGTFAVLPIILGGDAGVGFQITTVSFLEYLRTQPEVILHYVRLVLWPSPLILDHGWPPQDDPKMIVMAGGLLIGGIAACLFAITRGYRVAFFPIAALLVLLPTSSFIPLQDLAFEHRMYVPAGMLIAFILGVTLVISLRFPKFAYHAKIAICLALIVIAGRMTHTRNLDYHSSVLMWEDVVAKTIGAGHEHFLAGRLFNNLGNAYADEKKWESSLSALERAVERGTFSGPTYSNLARGYIATGQLKKAKAATLKATELQPKNARVRQQLGLIAVQLGSVDEALEHFLAASRLDPNDRLIMANVAQAYLDKGQFDKAESWLTQIIRREPGNRDALKKLMLLAAQRGELANAEKRFVEYSSQYPDDADALFSLARIQLALAAEKSGSEDSAIKTLERCIELAETSKGANLLLANLYRKRGDINLAKKHYERETRVNPRSVDAWNNLAGLTATDDQRQAIEYFEKVLSIAPDYHQAAYNIAAVHVSIGQTDAAVKRLEQLLAKVDFPPARELLEKLQSLAAPSR